MFQNSVAAILKKLPKLIRRALCITPSYEFVHIPITRDEGNVSEEWEEAEKQEREEAEEQEREEEEEEAEGKNEKVICKEINLYEIKHDL